MQELIKLVNSDATGKDDGTGQGKGKGKGKRVLWLQLCKPSALTPAPPLVPSTSTRSCSRHPPLRRRGGPAVVRACGPHASGLFERARTCEEAVESVSGGTSPCV